MIKRFKKIFYLIFSIILLIGFSACSKKDSKNVKELKVVDTRSLINNIVNNEEKDDTSKKIVEQEKLEENKEDTEKQKSNKKETDKNIEDKDTNKEDKEKSSKDIKTVTIKAFGDIMGHMGQSVYAKNKGGGEYDFSDQFSYIKDFIKDSDIAIGNYEATSNPELPISGYPKFNLPVSYPKYIKEAGFDILTTANNHSIDTGEEGVFSTIKAIEDAGLDHVGTQSEDEDRIIYKTVNDIKIAFLSYTYGVNNLESTVINYDPNKIVNYLDEEIIEKDIKTAKNSNADFVVVYPHWGIEYQSYPSVDQISLGRKMIDWGADIVIGNHPHVVQPAEYYDTEDGRRGFIAYALGNMISRQNLESVGDIRTEQSVAYEIILSKDTKDDKTNIDKVKAYPLWVGTTYNEYGSNTQTYLVRDFLGDGKFANKVDENQKYRLEQAQDMVNKTVLTDTDYKK
ncbi:MAG: CapA family protein [Anaerococcus sp.]